MPSKFRLRRIFKPLVIKMAEQFSKISMTPNQASYLMLFFSAVSFVMLFVVENFILFGIFVFITGIFDGIDGAIAVILLGCGTYLITIVSEKYRSTYNRDYPKREWEPFFVLITSGRDARIFHISVAAVLTVIDVRILYYVILGVGLLMYANFIYRVYKIGRHASE